MVNFHYPNVTPGYHPPADKRDDIARDQQSLADARKPASMGPIGLAIVAMLFLAALVFSLLNYAFDIDRYADRPDVVGQSVHPKTPAGAPAPGTRF